MPRQFLPALLASVSCALLLLTAAGLKSQTREARDTRLQLEQLEADIARISAAQRERAGERSEVQDALRAIELQLESLGKELSALEQQISGAELELAALEARREELLAQADAQRDAVAAELRDAYSTTGTDELKLLLNQDDPQAMARLLAYYRHILRARGELLAEFRDTLGDLEALEEKLTTTRATLQARRGDLAGRRSELNNRRDERAKLLAQIDEAMAADEVALKERQRNREQLEVLLEEIEEAMAATAIPSEAQPFSEARGQMPWPVEGRIVDRFGQARNRGKMRWQGVRLSAEAGDTVSAIHHGRVVYADWLRGSGLLLVLDHGEGYMSLYAHNQALLREVGDWVSTGAAISTVGDSGGQSEAALYFEIRKDGKPTNPQGWCRK